MRFTRLLSQRLTSSPVPSRPYQTLLQAMRLGGRGLLVASDVFQQFKLFFQQTRGHQALEGTTPLLPQTPGGDDHGGVIYQQPLTAFCGTPEEVEPFTILMMKVLCDLRRVEEMRFLFALYLSELSARARPTPPIADKGDDYTSVAPPPVRPSVELFNVYLSAISSTDTFNAHEIENVERFMDVNEVQGDVVTRLSLFLLHLRLGEGETLDDHRVGGGDGDREESPSRVTWPSVLDEVRHIIQEKRVEEFPLLELRLLHCFQVLVRLHHNVQVIHDCFLLLRDACPWRLRSEQHLIPYMVLSVANYATPPHMVMDILRLLDERRVAGEADHEENRADIRRSGSNTSRHHRHSTSSTQEDTNASILVPHNRSPPPLHSELTAFRLAAKCAVQRDPTSMMYLLDYLERCASEGFRVISPENKPMLTLLHLQALARAGRSIEALMAAEKAAAAAAAAAAAEERPGINSAIAVWFVPGEQRPRIRVQDRRVLLATPEPVADIVECLATMGVEGLESILDTLLAQSTTLPVDATVAPTSTPTSTPPPPPPPPPVTRTTAAGAVASLEHHPPFTGVTLQFLLAAAARLGASDFAARLLSAYADVDIPTPFALASYIMAALPHRPPLAADRVRQVLGWLDHSEKTSTSTTIHDHLRSIRRSPSPERANDLHHRRERSRALPFGTSSAVSSPTTSVGSPRAVGTAIRMDRHLLHACMEAAISAGDARLGRQVSERGARERLGVEIRHGARLVQLAGSLGDCALVQHVRDVLRQTRTPIDPSSIAVFKAMNL